MSRASKVFLASSVVLTTATVWGVHFLQKRESDTMYLGVLRDEARIKDKAARLASALTPSALLPSTHSPSSSSSSSSSSSHSPSPLSSSPSSPTPSSSASSSSAHPPFTPSISQPAPVIDPDCEVCRISPPPQISEKQSADERRMEREMRAQEYVAQRKLAEDLGREQGVKQERLV
ncbi:hypothetical protein EHS25_000701 [Saitozyma podzolica]|uniref:Uncharacterized protein n=1 Tax=Saitozyma podzolica TaxID=1890683 RepID=A0A427YWY5_9TREE|nr:hypothetical protein EHS25_000701 [Saitozyma podzolica]